MTRVIRSAVVVMLVAVAGLVCGPGAAAESQSAASDFLKGLSKMAARQTFTGTVVVSDSASGASTTDEGRTSRSETRTSLNHTVAFTVTTNGVVANVTYELKSRFDSQLLYDSHRVVGSKTEETRASGENRDGASVSVDLRDGTYQINFSSGGVTGEYRMVDTAETICSQQNVNPTCRPGTSSNEDSGKPPDLGGLAGSADGKFDPTQPNVLRGSVVQRHELNDGSTATRTVTWNLSRAK